MQISCICSEESKESNSINITSDNRVTDTIAKAKEVLLKVKAIVNLPKTLFAIILNYLLRFGMR